MSLSDREQRGLVALAYESIEYGLKKGGVMRVRARDYGEELREDRATFVTIKIADRLRGCIGTIDPMRPLVEDVVHNAYAAAFRDPRFPPLTKREYKNLDLSISILSLRESLEFSSEEDLVRQMRANVDGMVLEEDFHCGAFLPVMWEMLPEAEEFLNQLKIKAGLATDYWSETIKVSRFTTEYYLRSKELLD